MLSPYSCSLLHHRRQPQLSDPDDEMGLEAAINGHARRIVTFNVKDFARPSCLASKR